MRIKQSFCLPCYQGGNLDLPDLFKAVREIGYAATEIWDRSMFENRQELTYRGICAAIAASDYAGYVAHEFTPKGDPVEALRTAFELCDIG